MKWKRRYSGILIIRVARWRSDRVGVPTREQHCPWRPQRGGFTTCYAIDHRTNRYYEVNILIDSQRRARLADFGLATIVDESTSRTTTAVGKKQGTIRWMAPELLYPDMFEFTGRFENQLPSKDTDIYAIGMTILEVSARPCPSKTRISPSDRS